METNPVPAPGETDAPEGVGAEASPQPPSDSPGAAQPAGLTNHLRKAWRALERAGYLGGGRPAAPSPDPASGAGDGSMPGDPGGVTFAPVEAREAFDEAATRVGITGVVETADSLAAQFVTRAAAEVVGEHDAQKFGERAKMTPALHDGIINAGVEVCRAENVNLPPHATLALLAGGWLMGVFAVVKDIKALKQNAQRGTRPAEKEKDE